LELPPKYYLEQVREASSAADFKPRNAETVFKIWKSRMMAQSDISGVAILPLLANLVQYMDLQCKEPQDRILVLLSVSKDSDALEIVPNYDPQVD
jgi:hypothetical protein